jgi:hypothetical protein
MATGFSGLGLGELGAESKYIGKSNTYYRPAVTKNAKGEPQYDLLGRVFNGIEDIASKYAGDKLTPALNWLQDKLAPAVPPGATPMAVSPIAPPSSAAPSSIVAAPGDANADHPELQGILAVDPYAQIKP